MEKIYKNNNEIFIGFQDFTNIEIDLKNNSE